MKRPNINKGSIKSADTNKATKASNIVRQRHSYAISLGVMKSLQKNLARNLEI